MPVSVRLIAKIGPLYVGVGTIAAGVPSLIFSRPPADHALRELHHRVHDVLDHDDRDARFVEPEQDASTSLTSLADNPAIASSANKQARLGGERACQLEFAHLDLRQVPRNLGARLREPTCRACAWQRVLDLGR